MLLLTSTAFKIFKICNNDTVLHVYESARIIWKSDKSSLFAKPEVFIVIKERFYATPYKNEKIKTPMHLKNYDTSQKYFTC